LINFLLSIKFVIIVGTLKFNQADTNPSKFHFFPSLTQPCV